MAGVAAMTMTVAGLVVLPLSVPAASGREALPAVRAPATGFISPYAGSLNSLDGHPLAQYVAAQGIGVLAPRAAVPAPPTVVKVSGVATGTLANAPDSTARVSNAIRKGDGSVSGTFRITVSGQPTNITVAADQVVPPSPGGPGLISDGFFCLSGPDTTQQPGVRYNLYIRDSGNGKTTFDQWAAISGFDCGTTNRPNVETPTSGDFQTVVVHLSDG